MIHTKSSADISTQHGDLIITKKILSKKIEDLCTIASREDNIGKQALEPGREFENF